MSLVSIITAAYRAESFIARAAKSALAQTHSNFEMIIVSDDGADYQAILAQQGITDSRLRFSTTNATATGPSRARNVALDLAKGDFITTLDADDEYHPHYLEIMLEAASDNGIAMILLNGKEGRDVTPAQPRMLSLEQFARANGRNVTLFSRALLKHRYLETMRYGEDFFFDLRFFEYVETMPVLTQPYYIYHQNPESLSTPDNADAKFIEHYQKAIASVTADTAIAHAFLAACHHRLFQNHLYIRAKSLGQCRDFFDFMARFPQYFA